MEGPRLIPPTVQQVICSMPRSGGNMLISALRSGGLQAGEWPNDLPGDATTALVHLHYVDQLQHPIRRAVLLYRRNLLAQAVSWAIAHRTGDWKTGAPSPPIHIDTAEVVQYAGELRAARSDWLDWLSARSVPTMPVAYEDLCDPGNRAMRRVGTWLGAKAARTVPTTKRQATWVNEVWVGGVQVDLAMLLTAEPDGLPGRLSRMKAMHGYQDPAGRRVDRGL